MDVSSLRIDGKVALVTGAGRGIGLAIAKTLAGAGAHVAIQDIDLAVAQAEADAINASGGRSIALAGDLTNLDLPEQLVAQTLQQLGGLDILVNNGSIQARQHWTQMALDDMKRQFDADLLCPILLSRLAVPHMKSKQWGRIINIGSIQGRGGNQEMLPYSLSKVCMEKFAKVLARDLAKDQITANCIAPGWMNTWRNREDFKDEQDLRDKGRHVPLGRIGEPADCAGVALLLASDAGSYITGQCIYVDGGMSAW